MTEAPQPLVPAEVDLRDFQGMWIDTDRLLRSDTWVLGTGDEKAAAMTLWLESWHQVPAASLPSNDRMLAKLSQADRWPKVKEHALRGWVLCSDGRRYHPVVAEKALEAWIEKLAAAISGAAGNAKRWQVEIDTSVQREQLRVAADLLRSLNPASRTFKKKAVAVILSGSPPESHPDIQRPSPPESPPDAGDESPPDRKGPDRTGPDQTGVVEQPPVVAASKPRASRKAPPDFVLTTELRAWAAENAPLVSPDAEHAKLLDHTFATARSDWPGTMRNWLRKAQEDAQQRGMRQPVNGRAAEPEWRREQRDRMQAFAGPAAAKRPDAQATIDMEATDATARLVG